MASNFQEICRTGLEGPLLARTKDQRLRAADAFRGPGKNLFWNEGASHSSPDQGSGGAAIKTPKNSRPGLPGPRPLVTSFQRFLPDKSSMISCGWKASKSESTSSKTGMCSLLPPSLQLIVLRTEDLSDSLRSSRLGNVFGLFVVHRSYLFPKVLFNI